MARDARREYRARVRRARERGFPSYWAERRAPRILRRTADFARLPEPARESRSDAARVIAHARRERISAQDAAGELGVPVSVVRWWFPQALGPTRAGRTGVTPADRALRLRPLFVVGQGLVFIGVRGSHAADLADEVFRAQWRFIGREGSVAELERFRGLRIGGALVETDPDVLERHGDAGVDVIEAYRDLVP